MDPRQRRTTERLFRAVLDLARATPVTDLTIKQVAEAAGVHRSTFYEYAASPAELLRAALLAELDTLRSGLLEDPTRDTQRAVDDVTGRVLEHVRRHAGIYRRGLAADSGDASLHAMLSEHFLGSSRLLLAQGRVRLGISVEGIAPAVADDAALRFIAQGTVGAIEAWLTLAELPEPETFLRLYAQLTPSWWRQA